MRRVRRWLPLLLSVCPFAAVLGEGTPIRETWDYVPAMKQVASTFRGRAGVVLHVGDSITYANPYGQWARHGQGKTPDDVAVLEWMHCGADDDTDGWWLCRFDHPAGGRSYTAASGIRIDQMLAGGRGGMSSLAQMLQEYRPQMVVLMLGTNDASANRPTDAYQRDMQRAVDLILDGGVICILSTIPPHPHRTELAGEYNQALRQIAKARGLPLVDYEQEILSRRPNDWNGTLLGAGDVHPTASVGGGVNSASAPTAENLSKSGYLLRGWLSVQKIAEVKRKVLDELPPPAAPTARDRSVPRPEAPESSGEPVRVPVTRDTWLSAVGDEAGCNMGGARKLKLKSIQEMSVVDIDPQPLRGRVVEKAILHLKDSGKEILHRVTVSTVSSDWVEGTATTYEPQQGSSSFAARENPQLPWAFPQSDFTAVVLGQGGSIWRMADATPPDPQGWQQVPVDPRVVAARVAGTSYGFLIFDDTGSEWTRQGESFELRLFPNRYVHSRESGEENAPYFTVWLGPVDREPPPAPTRLMAETEGLPAGEARVSWAVPADSGPAGTIGFFVEADGEPLPRYLIPPARRLAEKVTMRLRDLVLERGASVELTVRAVDAAGNVGPAASTSIRLSDKVPAALPGKSPQPYQGAGPLPKLGAARVAIIDALDKIQPLTGKMIPEQAAGYLAANHLWSAEDKQVRLAAARNEFVAFQIVLDGPVSGVRPSLTFDEKSKGIRAAFARYWHVPSELGPLVDPVVSLAGPVDVPSPEEHIPGLARSSILCEVYVPHYASAGLHRGTLQLRSGSEALKVDVAVWVWDFTLPDVLSFLPEMNCYSLPDNERDYYRLAHEHRTVLNRVPYSQRGEVDQGCAPAWDGRALDWAAWDERFGPYLDGSAFADLPRSRVPLDCLYLPLHENWPSKIEGHYNGGYWADQAFDAAYREAFVEVARQMAEHLQSRGWHQTIFQCYLNNKNSYKHRGWSRGSSPWLLDEPANFQDYWALRWFGEAFHEGVRKALGPSGAGAKLCFRCDISRPQWQRDSLDHVLDYNVVGGGAFRRYHRLVTDRKGEFAQIVVDYGSANAIEESNVQPVGWCLDSWTLSSDGVVPWQTIGTEQSWRRADRLSLFYPGQVVGRDEPVPSIRLKAFRRGQQDAEYLTLLARASGEPRWSLGRAVRQELGLAAEHRGTGSGAEEDAGVVHFADLLPQDAWALRIRVGRALSDLHPEAKRKLVELRTPPRDPAAAPPAYVAGYPAAVSESADRPALARTTVVKVLQGRKVVRDAMIDPESPDKSFGSVARDNRMVRRDATSAFLVRFDLDRLDLGADPRIDKATVSFYVWDPSSRGNAKVCAFGLKTPWEEAAATWNRPSADASWKGGDAFAFGLDTTEPVDHVVVPPDAGSDTVDPPLEYRLDVTSLVRNWLAGTIPNNGLAIATVIDRAVDEGHFTRLQVLASEHGEARYTPKLEVQVRPDS